MGKKVECPKGRIVSARLTDEQYAALLAQSQRMARRLSDLVRDRLLPEDADAKTL